MVTQPRGKWVFEFSLQRSLIWRRHWSRKTLQKDYLTHSSNSRSTVHTPNMSKSIGRTGDFTRLFRKTRLAQVPDKLGELGRDKSQAFPTHQIIESLPAAYSRRDFGLKIRLPRKLSTRYVVYNDLDNKFGLPDFEPLNGFYWKKLRFQELGIPIKPKINTLTSNANAITKANPLFPLNSTIRKLQKESPVEDQSIASVLNLELHPLDSHQFQNITKPALRRLRKPFMKWLVENHPDRLSHIDLSKEIIQFIKETKPQLQLENKSENKQQIAPKSYGEKLSGTAGLSYNLKGRLFQTPNGIHYSKILPGRFLQGKVSGNLFGVGGFVGTSTSSHSKVQYLNRLVGNVARPLPGTDTFANDFKIPIQPKSASLSLDKRRLEIEVEPVRSPDRYSGASTTTLASKNGSSQKSGSDDILSSLLGLLEATDKK